MELKVPTMAILRNQSYRLIILDGIESERKTEISIISRKKG